MDNTESMEVPHVRPEESANSEQTEIFDVGKTKDSVVESNTKESELGDVETTTLSGTSQKEPCEEVLDSKNQEDLGNGKGNSVLTETTNPPVNDNSSESRKFEDGEGNVADSGEERSQEGEGQDPGTCDDAGAQSKDKTLKITETLENNRENVSNLDRQAKGESAPSSPVECYTSESSLYSDSDGENAGSLKKESTLLSRGSVQGASASEELLECDMTNTEKQRVSLDETLESVKDGLNHSEASLKDLSGDKVVHYNNTEEMSTKRDDDTGVPIPDIGVITDSKEGSKGNVEESKEQDVETTTKGEPVLASVEMTTCPEASQKNPSGDEVVEYNDLENLSTDKCGTGVPTATPPNMSSIPPEAGVITISKEDNKGNFEKSNVHDKETATKEVADKSEVTNEVTTTSTTETDPHGAITVMNNLDEQIILPPEKEKSVRQIESTNSNGLSPVESKSELNSFDGDKSPEAFIQSQITETITEGTSSTINSKDSEMLPAGIGNVKTQLKVSEDSEESCPVEKTSESDVNKGIVSEEEESASVGSQEFNLLSSILSSDHGESESTGQGIIRISNASIEEIGSALGQIFQMIASREGGASSGASSDEEDQISWRPEPYCKAGYSVVISNSKLCESTEEKAVVTMESGTEFFISIGNNNDRAAEVDITFGGIYLGVWLVEAKQSLSNPLIIEGCTWAAGRFKFFSASDKKKLQPNVDIYGERAEVDGLIELKFKPEADTMKMFVHHVREQGSYRLVPVTVADPRTATIADLKQEIKGSWGSSISCLLKGGQVLQEEETISSYDLGENEVIEVVNATEELTIEAVGRDPISLMVDPKNISVKALKEFITAQFKIPVDQQLLQFKEQDGVVDSKSITHMLLTSRKTPVLVVSREEPGAEDSRGLDTSARSCEDQGSRAEDSCKLNEESNDSGDNDQNGVAILYGNKESVYKQFREDAMDRKFSRKKAVTLFIQLKDKSKKAANAKTKPEPKPFEQPGTSSSRPKGCTSSLYPPETPD